MLIKFLAFDPSLKRAEATIRQADGSVARVVKGAFAAVHDLAKSPTDALVIADSLQAKGYRVLAVAVGPAAAMRLAGLIALSDPPREDSAGLVAELKRSGVRTIMVTGDAVATAKIVAAAIGIAGPAWATTPLPEDIRADEFSLFAGVLPEDKYRLVKALQKAGHIVGMCGDGANDAPALRQAQMGIAVSTATDVAKASAGMVLTEPGLGGIVAAVRTGRATFQRILTYTLRTIVHKTVQVLFLSIGLVMTGQAILTPMLMVLMMVTGDFLAMSSSTDNVRPSETPSVWRIGRLTVAGVLMGMADLLFCVSCLATGRFVLHLDPVTVRTLTVVTLVFSSQAVFYVSRERRHLWSSRPGRWLLVSSVVDLSFISLLAEQGILMAPLPIEVLAGLFLAAAAFAFLLDAVKLVVFRCLQIA
jgi:H+-transporting ATPase